MVRKMVERPMWTVVDHVSLSKNVEKDRGALIDRTVKLVFVYPILVKVSIVTRDHIRTSTASATLLR